MPQKWGSVEDGVLPAWVAEMDIAPPEPVVTALRNAVDAGTFGYPGMALGVGLAVAYAGFASRHFGQDRGVVAIPVVDVTAGVRLALDVLSGPGPLVLPVPAYPPHHDVARITGRATSSCRSSPTRRRRRSTSIGSIACCVTELERCCSRSPTTRGGACAHEPSSRACATSSLVTARE